MSKSKIEQFSLVVSNESKRLQGWIAENGCDIKKYLTDIRVLPNSEKNSASESVILFANITLYGSLFGVTLKVVFKTLTLDNYLTVEQQIYEGVIDKLLVNKVTPHIISYIGRVENCNTKDFVNILSPENKVIFTETLDNLNLSHYSSDNLDIVILEKSQGTTMYDFMAKNPSEVDLEVVFFQILYTLLCFKNIGLSHSDLHFNNIFVETLPDSNLEYDLVDLRVRLKTKYIVKIFDFDRGSIYHPAVERNFGLDSTLCVDGGQCNEYVDRRDLSMVVAGMFSVVRNPNIINYLNSITSVNFRKNVKARGVNVQIDPKRWDNNDLASIKECITILIKDKKPFEVVYKDDYSAQMDVNQMDVDQEIFTLYTLPKVRRHRVWNPISLQTHLPYTQFEIDPIRPPTYKTLIKYAQMLTTPLGVGEVRNPYLKGLVNTDTIIYKLEFDDLSKSRQILTIDENYQTLFAHYLVTRPIGVKYYKIISIATYILCLPFIYSLSKDKLIKYINKKYNKLPNRIYYTKQHPGGIPNPNDYMDPDSLVNPRAVIKIMDDIWNYFNNFLPITVFQI